MAEASLQDRLRDHATAFDGLLSLIPATMYYGQDNSDQWKKKKQTKEEAAAARRGKLDPDSELNRNAKEVMDERAKSKRKLRDMEQEDNVVEDNEWEDYEPVDGVEAEKPGEGLRKKAEETNKKQKIDDGSEEDVPTTISEATTSKLSKKEEKRAAKREKKKEKKAAPKEEKPVEASASTPATKSKKQASKKAAKSAAATADESDAEGTETSKDPKGEVEQIDVSGLEKDYEAAARSSSDSEVQSPTFDTNESLALADPASTTTSVSSTIPPSEKPKHIKIPADTEALRARLAAKIEALRAARKADGPDGKPIRTRQELIESRRRKEALRKEHKKELRQQAKLDELQRREEALASNSPGIMSPAVEVDDASGGYGFGRVAFADGSKLSHDLSYVLNSGKRKGPSDPKTALLKVQNQKKRMENLDEEKRKDVEEKEAWLNARRRVEGEKIRDDEGLLKRAVKRKEVTKRKSEKAWRERVDGVKHAQKERQKKREDNLRKRRDEKLLGKAGKKKKGGATKKKARPGFEGSFGVGGRKK